MRKPIIGEELYLIQEEKNKDKIIGYVKVITVGRKYFKIDYPIYVGYSNFYINSWKQKTEYSQEYYLYENEKAYLDKLETDKYIRILHNNLYHGWYGYSLYQLKKIVEILEIKIDE